MKIYVGNLSFGTTEDQLRDQFAEHGDVGEVVIVTDRDTGRSRGFGFVTLDDDGAARGAIEALNGTEVDGRTLTVNEAKPRAPRTGGGGGYGGGRGGGGGGRRDRW